MSYIELSFDENKNLFSIPVILTRKVDKPQYGSVSQFKASHHINEVMYIDTGSSLSSITQGIADKLSIDVNSLTLSEVGGIGGITMIPVTDDIIIIVGSNDSQFKEIKLDKIAVNPDNLTKKIKKGKGAFKQRGESSTPMFALCGLDALAQMGGKLILDIRNKEGRIEFSN